MQREMAERASVLQHLQLSSFSRRKALYIKKLFSDLAFTLQTFQPVEKGTFRYLQVLKRYSLAPVKLCSKWLLSDLSILDYGDSIALGQH